MNMKGYVRVATLMPDIKVGNPKFNIETIKEEILKANTLSVKLCVLPELCITSNSLQSLYLDRNLLNESLNSLFSLLTFSSELDLLIVVSAPIEINLKIFEVAFVIKSGKILGAVPKSKFCKDDINYGIFSTDVLNINEYVIYDDEKNCEYRFPISNDIVFRTSNLSFSVAFNGLLNDNLHTNIVCNVDSIPETIDVDSKIRELKTLSLVKNCIIITSTPGTTESTDRYAYFGRSFICEVGKVIAKNDIITNHMLISDVDIDYTESLVKNEFFNNPSINVYFNFTNYIYNNISESLFRDFDKFPYINKKVSPYNYSMHIINILSVALAKRMKTIDATNIVIGVSGGLDSTIALLVAKKTVEFLSLQSNNIKAISMPGLGTTDESNNNVINLLDSLNIKINVVDIKNSVLNHFNDIHHDINNTNVTYENSQARERTQILMDIANDCNGIVIGTGDLSEIALGFSTYNGDHISMYNVNGSLPKTLIKYILKSIANEVLNNILHAKISPELLPTENGILLQKTEDILGNYEIHDFLLYNYLKFNFDYNKLYDLALRTFVYNNDTNKVYTEEYIKNCLNIFFNRFYKAQYKRSASPDSPDIGLPNLNALYSYKIPNDTEIKY